jgi:hypothetical protein
MNINHLKKRATNMQLKNVKLSTVLLFGICLTGLQAQEGIPTSGGNASGSGGSVSYSVGQLVCGTNSGITGSMTQGVQQPFEISVISGIAEAKDITLQCSAYPNPVIDYVKLKVENYKTEDLTYQLYNVSGKLLENKKIEGNETTISMGTLVPTIYFLRVLDNNNEVKTFKIIKN